MRDRLAISFVLFAAACGDNEAAPPDDPTPRFEVAMLGEALTEQSSVTLMVRRMGSAVGRVSVDFATAEGDATAADYSAQQGTLVWEDGDASPKAITIDGIDDKVIEPNEVFSLELSNAQGAMLDANAASTPITILSNDRVGELVALTSKGRIVSIDRDSPSITRHEVALSGMVGNEWLVGMDRRPLDGSLWGLSSAGVLYTIDAATGVATKKATLVADTTDTTQPFSTLSGADFGVDFNPVPDRLRVTSDTGLNLRINVDTGATITDGAINGVATGYGAVGYTTSFAAACRTTLYAIDSANDRLVIQNPPNNGTAITVGSLGIDAVASAAFDIQTDASGNRALAALFASGEAALFNIDLATGAASKIGKLGLETGESALSLVTVTPTGAIPQAPGELYGLTEPDGLISFNRAAPAKPCTSAPITGVMQGDLLAGIDFRPSTGVLHALARNANTNAGRIYTIDPATGAASSPVTLSVPLQGNSFGMDFNPTGPVALRIVSDTGQNLRVTDVATGATTADGNLNGATVGFGVNGAAYTDSVAGAGTTTLYVLDSVTDRLRIQNPPNAGTLVDVGAFGVDLDFFAGFDIDGRDNTAFVVTNNGGATPTTLRTIDLTTGAISASLGTLPGFVRGITRVPPVTNVFGLTTNNTLLRLSIANPSQVTTVGTVTGLASGESLIGIDVRPSTGVLYGVGSLGNAYSIDPSTAAATRVSGLDVALSGTSFGLDFNPTGPVALRLVSDAEQNLRIPDITRGMVTTDVSLVRAARDYSLGAAAYSNNIPGATTTTLYALDATTDRLVAIVSPNSGVIREIGSLGIDINDATAFEIVGPDTALAVVNGLSLVSVNLATGAATPIGTINCSSVAGIAAPPSATAPAANSLVYVLANDGTLLSIARNAPGAPTTIGTATFGSGETIAGFDVRPSTGELWVMTNAAGTGRLYTLDPSTGAATLRGTLGAPLIGKSFGFDFNPTGPVALRIVSEADQNLRVVDPTVPETVPTNIDASINVPAPDAVAAAYTNSFAGSLATQLFVIDTTTASLQLQNPPNNGVLAPIGALSASLSFTNLAAFDIAGGNNGIALAALQRTGEGGSRLYRINLATGAATELGVGIGADTTPVRGLAIQLR